jgi:hypothetical protein
MVRYQLLHLAREGLGRGWTDLQAQPARRAAQVHLDIMALGLEKLGGGQK